MIVIVPCPTCWGMGKICNGINDDLTPILKDCPNCGGHCFIIVREIEITRTKGDGMNELNRKLAERAGFEESHNRWHFELTKKIMDWIFPDKSHVGKLPNFTQSLDACFEWLVPEDCSVCFNREPSGTVCMLTIPNPPGVYGSRVYVGKANLNEDALALCLAREKQIDGEK